MWFSWTWNETINFFCFFDVDSVRVGGGGDIDSYSSNMDINPTYFIREIRVGLRTSVAHLQNIYRRSSLSSSVLYPDYMDRSSLLCEIHTYIHTFEDRIVMSHLLHLFTLYIHFIKAITSTRLNYSKYKYNLFYKQN